MTNIFGQPGQVSQKQKEPKETLIIKTITLNGHKMSNPNVTGEFLIEKAMHD